MLLLILGFLLRIYPNFDTFLFSYDQARDLIVSEQILKGDIKLVGPPSDIPTLFHGPLYYYYLAIVSWLSANNINLIFTAIIIVNLLTLAPIILIAKELFAKKEAQFFSGFLFATSFAAVSYARLISNVSLALPGLGLYYLGLSRILKKHSDSWLLASLGLGIAIQSELFLAYLLLITPIFIYLFKVKLPNIKILASSLFIILLFLSTFIVAEIKFKFQGIAGAISYLKNGLDPNSIKSERLPNFVNKLDEFLRSTITLNSWQITWLIFAMIVLATAILLKRKAKDQKPIYFLLFLLAANSFTYIVTTFDASYVNIGLLIPFFILSGHIISQFGQKSKILAATLVIFIVVSNVYSIYKYAPEGNVHFQIQQNVRCKDRLDVVNKTYEIAKGEIFSINTVNLPLYHPTTWAYLYDYYAKEHGQKLPHYHGNTASDFVGVQIFPRSGEITNYEFTIIEPDVPEHWIQKGIEADDLRTKVIREELINGYRLQVRHAK